MQRGAPAARDDACSSSASAPSTTTARASTARRWSSTGFVAGDVDGGFELARYQIACCAADAEPVVVRVLGTSGDPPSRDQWVTVTGTFKPGGGDIPDLNSTSVVQIPAPNDPYE